MLWLLCVVFWWPCAARGYQPQFADANQKIKLRWKSNVIKIALSESLRQPAANIKPGSDVGGAAQRALATWETAANIKFNVVWSNKLSLSPSDNPDGASLITVAATAENVVPFQGANSDLPGRTRTFFTARGVITEADIVLNPYQQFSTDGTFGTYDLQAALTHEIGHLLGLDHAAIRSAAMYSQQAKNGTFSLPAVTARSLAEDDRAGVRALYGATLENQNCCGGIAVTLTNSNGKALNNWLVWAEEINTGRLAAAAVTGNAGAIALNGLQAAKYRLIAQPVSDNFSAETIGEIALENNQTINLNRRLQVRPVNLRFTFAGYNAQLSTVAVPLDQTARAPQLIFLGGDNLTVANFANRDFSASSPLIKIAADTITAHDFESDITVISFQLTAKPQIQTGEYGLRWQKPTGETIYLPGVFTVQP